MLLENNFYNKIKLYTTIVDYTLPKPTSVKHALNDSERKTYMQLEFYDILKKYVDLSSSSYKQEYYRQQVGLLY